MTTNMYFKSFDNYFKNFVQPELVDRSLYESKGATVVISEQKIAEEIIENNTFKGKKIKFNIQSLSDSKDPIL